jgi:hypothetical protein
MKFLVALAILIVALIIAPLIIALPPVNQTPAMLATAHLAQALAPFLSVAMAILAAVQLWRERTWRAGVLLTVALIFSTLSRMNLLERVFAPARDVMIINAGAFHDIRDTDMVIGVVTGGRSRAYPVRYLAYHHMLNDKLGSFALLPTY